MRKLLLALAIIAASAPFARADTTLFSLSVRTSTEDYGCRLQFRLSNVSGKQLQTYAATVSIHSPAGTSMGGRPIKFEHVDNRSDGTDELRFSDRCDRLGKIVLRDVERCVLAGQRSTGCRDATEVEVSRYSLSKIDFTR